MKKKLLTTVLTVGVVLSLVGCGAKETTSSESVAETTEVTTEYGTEETTVEEVVEETTVAETEAVEEVVEEPAKEKIPVDITDGAAVMNQVLENFNKQKYVVEASVSTEYNAEDPTAKITNELECLYDWNSNIACDIGKAGDVTYYDIAESMIYLPKEDLSGFVKTRHENSTEMILGLYNALLERWISHDANFTITEVTDGEFAGNYCATNEYTTQSNTLYRVTVYIDAYTLLPTNVMVVLCDLNHELVLEDGTAVSGEYFIRYEKISKFQFLTEEDADFATFQEAIKLPADDECTLVEGETTTTE